MFSSNSFRSSDLGVMGPARFQLRHDAVARFLPKQIKNLYSPLTLKIAHVYFISPSPVAAGALEGRDALCPLDPFFMEVCSWNEPLVSTKLKGALQDEQSLEDIPGRTAR